MRIATWNVNSLKARLEKVTWWLARAKPDVLLMQETKLSDADAPADAFRDAGYELAHHGEGRWNGVAVASRVGAPLGHDYAVISLSDRLKPWDVIAARLRAAAAADLSAGAFRDLALQFKQHEVTHRDEVKIQLAETHHKQAQEMLQARLTETSWQHMLRNARAAAQKGEEEQLLLRFPSELCTDHGRAINAPDPAWPATLRGLAAEIFLRWKKELQPQGFGLAARVVEFPDGLPGDIGLFLEWGRRD